MMDTQLEVMRISEIEEQPVEFLVEPYIPLGKIVIVAGDAGTGKTHIVLAIAAAVTRGEPLPWETERGSREPANVIFQSMEDSYGDTIKPRLKKLGADCDRVCVINESQQPLRLDDLRIEQAIVKTGAKFCVFDPISAYCIGLDMSSSGGIRPVLTQLADIAARTNCSIVCIAHLNKNGSKSQYRTLGSVDITAVARSVLTVGKYPNDDEMRVFIHSKSNLTAPGSPQCFGIDDTNGVVWLGECSITLDEMLSGKFDPSKQLKIPSALEVAKQFVVSALESGEVPATDIKAHAEAEGISKNTLARAKSALGVSSVKQGDCWYWALPNSGTDEPQEPQGTQE